MFAHFIRVARKVWKDIIQVVYIGIAGKEEGRAEDGLISLYAFGFLGSFF
jgi:hypothetical protein